MLIVVAMPQEVSLVKSIRPEDKILVTGIGAVNVITALRDVAKNTPILNVGYAGSNSIKLGTRCRIGKVALNHPKAAYKEPQFMLGGDTPCFTSSDFVTESDIAEPCVFDMELAYILALGFTNVVAEKIVSDNLSEKEYERFTGNHV